MVEKSHQRKKYLLLIDSSLLYVSSVPFYDLFSFSCLNAVAGVNLWNAIIVNKNLSSLVAEIISNNISHKDCHV
jgi:hypothetical protein